MPLPPEFTRLDHLQQAIVRLLAVAHSSVTRTELAACLKTMGVKTRTSRVFTAGAVAKELEPLQAAGLVRQENGVELPPALRDAVVAQLVESGGYAPILHSVEHEAPPLLRWDTSRRRAPARAIRRLRSVLLMGDQATSSAVRHAVFGAERARRQYPSFFRDAGPFEQACLQPVDWPSLLTADGALQCGFARDLVAPHRPALTDAEEGFVRHVLLTQDHPLDVPTRFARRLLLRGRIEEAEALVTGLDTHEADQLRGWVKLLQGDPKGAIRSFDRARKALRKEWGDRTAELGGTEALLWPLALLSVGDAASLKAALRLLNSQERRGDAPRDAVATLMLVANELQSGTPRVSPGLSRRPDPLGLLVSEVAAILLPRPRSTLIRRAVPDQARLCGESGWRWLERELWALHARLERVERTSLPRWGALEDVPGRPLVDLMEVREPWEARLEALASLSGAKKARGGTQRLVWVLAGRGRWFELTPKVQKLGKKGWTAGRAVALSRLKKGGPTLKYATEHDRAVMAALREVKGWYASSTEYEFDMPKALRALVGHPLLLDGGHQPLSLTLEALKIQVRETAEGTELSLAEPAPEGDFELRDDGLGRLTLVAPDARQKKAAALLTTPLLVPTGEKSRVHEALKAVSTVLEVHSDAASGPAQPGDPAPVLQLRRQGEGLAVRVRVRPLGPSGPSMVPGEGAVDVMASPDGEPLRARRDLDGERAALRDLAARIPALIRLEARPRAEVFLDGLEECLDLVSALVPLQAQGRVEWARGRPLEVVAPAQPFAVQVTASKDWFSAAGSVHLGDDQILALQELLAATDDSVGRYIQLADGRFLALTDGLVRGLRALRHVGTGSAEGINFHPMALPAVEELLEEAGGDRPGALAALKTRMRSAEQIVHPVPPTLKAELRDYQVAGFQWLARLADWGGGACLADDMGLGKTVQALALLLHRAADGPALVLAPMSVCAGWREEAARFAPTLRMHALPARGRAKAVEGLGPHDVLVVSHGLVPRAAEALASRRWSTVVVDEAQAIKNPSTKRAKAVFKLQAGFRLAATGTPVENRTEELWSLYRFLLPGLLGGLKRFQERYGQADEGARGKSVRQLRALLRPFLLRRLKSEVLASLPARTDVVRRVESGPKEASIYEALRRSAVAQLTDEQTGRMDVLSWLTKLRLAACDPRLVHDDAAPGAKAAELQDLVEELRMAGHRALIFSQFVRHLTLVRGWLEGADIPFQYLDGSTSAKARKQAVDAFQAGEGDVFLISLKAGGTGLNLTAADYVIHLDPWWNPAVEDQASDRAHRIGQTRPVTVVRLVTQGTVEEGILDLHQRKRELADGLLAETSTAAPLDFDELVALIGGMDPGRRH